MIMNVDWVRIRKVAYTDMTYYIPITLTLWLGIAGVMEAQLHILLTQGRGNEHSFFRCRGANVLMWVGMFAVLIDTFRLFCQPFYATTGTVRQVRSVLLPYTPCLVHYSRIILPFDAINFAEGDYSVLK
jgi:hypothetical protein